MSYLSGMRRLALAVLAVLLVPAGANAQPAKPECGGVRTQPRLSATPSLWSVPAGNAVDVSGYLWFDNCLVNGETVGLFVRDRAGPYHYVAKTVTGSQLAGNYWFRIPRITTALDVIVVHSASHRFDRAVSAPIHLTVGPARHDYPDPRCDRPDYRLSHLKYAEPPAGVTVEVADVPESVRTGATLPGWLVIRNGSRSTVVVITNEEHPTAVVVRATSGEAGAVAYPRFDERPQRYEIEADEEVSIPFRTLVLRTCQPLYQGFKLDPTTYEVHAWITVKQGDRSVHWRATPGSVNLTAI